MRDKKHVKRIRIVSKWGYLFVWKIFSENSTGKAGVPECTSHSG